MEVASYLGKLVFDISRSSLIEKWVSESTAEKIMEKLSTLKLSQQEVVSRLIEENWDTVHSEIELITLVENSIATVMDSIELCISSKSRQGIW